MAMTPNSYDPQFWSSAKYLSLDLYSGNPIRGASTVAKLLLEYFHHSTEHPTHFSYQTVSGGRRKLKAKTVGRLLEVMEAVKEPIESMYVECIRDDDHTHAVASAGYAYDTIIRPNVTFGVNCLDQYFDLSTARNLAVTVANELHIDCGFTSRQNGIANASSFGSWLRIDSDPFTEKRERWMKGFQWKQPRPSDVPFLNVFELNVLSDMHMSKLVSGRLFEAYVLSKGRGTLERIGKANFLWCLGPEDIAIAKAELAECSLVAMV